MRKTSLKVHKRNKPILDQIQALKTEHTFWGYRRIWAHLKFIDKIEINKKRVLRLTKESRLTVSHETQLKAKRTPEKSKPKAEKPNKIHGIDMTKIKLKGQGWA